MRMASFGASAKVLVVLVNCNALLFPANVLAQMHILGRQDKPDIVYVVNQPDGLNKARAIADKKGGQWDVLDESSACGYAAVWIAWGDEQRKYFVVTGKATSHAAMDAAALEARDYAKGRKGWQATSMRVFLNENRYALSPDWKRAIAEKVIPFKSCLERQDGAPTGVRG